MKGFTLIEISIVLVIIGLIAGGVLFGRDLIRIAGLRGQLTQIEMLNTTVTTFRLKYNCLPGDCKHAVSLGFGTSGGDGDNGNGNGTIDLGAVDFDSPEIRNFWYHLGQSGLTQAYPAGNIPGINTMPLKYRGYGLEGNSAGGFHVLPGHSDLIYPNEPIIRPVWLLTTSSIARDVAGVYLAIDVFYIDSKLDDGVATKGNTRVIAGDYALTGCYPDTCIGASVYNTSNGYAGACINDSIDITIGYYNTAPAAMSSSDVSLCMVYMKAQF